MNAPQSPPGPVPEAEASSEGEAPPPPPEPWTPARAVAWNAYYDLYIAGGVLLLGFLTSVARVANATIWTHLQAGRLILRRGPLTTDPFSVAAAGLRWVDIPWLYELASALIYNLGSLLVARDPPDRYGVAALIGVHALLRALTVLALLGLRRPGPGLWWVAVCAALAVLIAGPAPLAPETAGELLLAVELLLLHRAIDLGHRRSAVALVPLFALWANVDASFVVGLLLLAAAAVAGRAGADTALGAPSWSWTRRRGLAILGACLAAGLVNPSFLRAYPVAVSSLVANQVSPIGPEVWAASEQVGFLAVLVFVAIHYVIPVGLGLASFALDRRRLAPTRWAVFATAAVLWGVFNGLRDEAAVVLAATLALNGQEWYRRRFGTEGRLGAGWAAWSVGGRAITILVLFGAIARFLTGYGATAGDPTFGFDYNPDDFAFEAADALHREPIRGNVLNATPALGDALIWRAGPGPGADSAPRKPYIDGRRALFPAAVAEEYREVREALRGGKKKRWEPILNHHGIDVVMLNVGAGPGLGGLASGRTYLRLMDSPEEWIPFYDDGNVAMFGRADAPADDLAYFREHRLDATALAFRRARPVPSTIAIPPPATWLDRYFRARALAPTQPHVLAALRWLDPPGADPKGPRAVPDPARCILAVREARTALARRPDDPAGYRVLAFAYRWLMADESALLGGQGGGAGGGLALRLQQRIAALHFAIQTTPPPAADPEREALRELNLELAQLYEAVGCFDLERERLGAAIAGVRPGDIPADVQKRLDQLDRHLEESRAKIDEAAAAEPQAGALRRVVEAQRRGLLGLAIAELEEIEKQGTNPAQVRARLVDLDCQVGWLDRAQAILGQTDVDDPALETEPGMASYRQARVYLLLGHYELALFHWRRALARVQVVLVNRALDSASSGALFGDVKKATRDALALPGLLGTQATWEAEMGLVLLEAGEPKLAGERFTRALNLVPGQAVRPVVAYYLGQMGSPVPPLGPAGAPDKETGQAKAAQPRPAVPAPRADAPQGELPEDPFAPGHP